MKYLLKKAGILVITLLAISFVTFTIFTIIPGDSVITRLGTDADEMTIKAMRSELGLDKPVLIRYVNWIKDAAMGDLGHSFQYKIPVTVLLKERLPITITLAIISIIMILFLSIPLGILSAKEQGRWIDRMVRMLTQIVMSIPSFFLGIIITLFFGIGLKWFVPGEYIDYKNDFIGFLRILIFPALAIALPKSAMVIKYLRTSILDQMKQDYVRTAYSKGNQKKDVLYKHVLKNAIIPVITFLAMVIADVLAGSIIIEQVFNLPGIGRLLVVSISNRDYAVVQAIVLYLTATVIIINFMADVCNRIIDPRIR